MSKDERPPGLCLELASTRSARAPTCSTVSPPSTRPSRCSTQGVPSESPRRLSFVIPGIPTRGSSSQICAAPPNRLTRMFASPVEAAARHQVKSPRLPDRLQRSRCVGSPKGVSSRSLESVWRPLLDHSVSPWRTSHTFKLQRHSTTWISSKPLRVTRC